MDGVRKARGRARKLDLLLVIVDSLRADAIDATVTPFLHALGRRTVWFRRAHATECWTLPTHLSMFTGALPSQHGAHFRAMAYWASGPTMAELLAAEGYRTTLATRNSVFDGTLPGVTRGFTHVLRPLGELTGSARPLATMLALAKPRVRRLVRESGFFHALQKENREFLVTLARLAVPADHLVLEHAAGRLTSGRGPRRPEFLCLNLYDMHAPYPPTASSPLRSWRSPKGAIENVMLPFVLPRIASHAYLRPGFRLLPGARSMLRARYRAAAAMIDVRLAEFFSHLQAQGALEHTLVVVTADHGEAFGDHGLWLHDASTYQSHLHVPLWIHHPGVAPAIVDDVVSTRDLFGLLTAVGRGQGLLDTILDPKRRVRRAVALAEHFHYPHAGPVHARFRSDQAAAIVGRRKVVLRDDGALAYDLMSDTAEEWPQRADIEEFERVCRADGHPPEAIQVAMDHLRGWRARFRSRAGGDPVRRVAFA
ncbi:MAG: sulfatase-like hydrolase/transferase [bacterium]|nr:sulfatase-like hydrolase/transferase [bacterium]